jgi:hypothetical protein
VARRMGILMPVPDVQYTVAPQRPPRPTVADQAPTQQLPAMPDGASSIPTPRSLAAEGIFATFSGSDPRPTMTGPIPAQPESGDVDGHTRPPSLLDRVARWQAPPAADPDGAPHPAGWGPGSPRRVLIAVAGVLAVALVGLVTLINGGDGRSAARTASGTPAAAPAAAAADFGGTAPGDLTKVGSVQAQELLRSVGQNGTGTVVEAWTWKDSNGSNLVATTRTVEAGQHQSLKVIHLASMETDSPRTVRIMKDPNLPDCAAGGTAGFTKNSLLVRDLDGDGVAEVAAGWASRCQGARVSEVRLALISDGRKFIIRGQGVLGTGGSGVPDPKAASWPDGYAPALRKLFTRLYYKA